MRTVLRVTLTALFCLAFLVPSTMAKTPDGLTPAEEIVCDGLEGAAFGLCNAYCEAQDCDILDPERASCERLRTNFERATGSRIFPCDVLIETEPNNSCEDANPVVLGSPNPLLASISPVGDRDHFLLAVPEDSIVEIETTGPGGDTVLQIESADGTTIIGCDDDAGENLFSLWSCCLPAGDYCVVVRDFGDNSAIPLYEIDVRGLGACDARNLPPCPITGLGCPF